MLSPITQLLEQVNVDVGRYIEESFALAIFPACKSRIVSAIVVPVAVPVVCKLGRVVVVGHPVCWACCYDTPCSTHSSQHDT